MLHGKLLPRIGFSFVVTLREKHFVGIQPSGHGVSKQSRLSACHLFEQLLSLVELIEFNAQQGFVKQAFIESFGAWRNDVFWE